MKLPENPTKKVRDMIAVVLQCPGYNINKGGLYEIKKLCDRLDKVEESLKLTIDRWRLIGRKIWDTKTQVSVLELQRQLEKDIKQILKG